MVWQESLYSGKATPDESGHCPPGRRNRRLPAAHGQLRGKQQKQAAGRSVHLFHYGWFFQDAGGIASGGNQR